jgi:hypothetical protein
MKEDGSASTANVKRREMRTLNYSAQTLVEPERMHVARDQQKTPGCDCSRVFGRRGRGRMHGECADCKNNKTVAYWFRLREQRARAAERIFS